MNTKGVLVTIFFGFILLSSTVLFVLPGIDPNTDSPTVTITGTPADNFSDEERPRYCGSSDAKSTDYIQEFSIPTLCTNPLGIVADYDGNVWFTETNTGKVAKFDPVMEEFTEYDNPQWPPDARSMMWGIDYAPDGSVWFTDEVYDSIWRFSTLDGSYDRLPYPSEGNALPQKLSVEGSNIIVNDFTGNKITFLDANLSDGDINYLSVPSPRNGSVTADFAVDANDNVWFTTWLYLQGGVLIKFDQNEYVASTADLDDELLPVLDYFELYELPVALLTPNGAVVGDDGSVWLADTSSSSLFNFDPISQEFTQYVTSDPPLSSYGNQTGLIKSPVSGPYWIESDDRGRIIFNEQIANNISVLDTESQSLVEYHVPSKNPTWSDCDSGTAVLDDCGIAQVFDFTIYGDKIWFTEWVENNIGVVDTSVPLPVEIQLESDSLKLAPGTMVDFDYAISSQNVLPPYSLVLSTANDFLKVERSEIFGFDSPVSVTITASEDAPPGTYKVLLGAQLSDVTISKYVTVTVQ